MLKKILATASLMFAALSYAGIDINKATQADLDGIKGIGPGTAASILAERKKGDFKDWADLSNRVKGIKDKRAAKLSEAGLTVSGTSYAAVSTAPTTPTAAKAPTAPTAPTAKSGASSPQK